MKTKFAKADNRSERSANHSKIFGMVAIPSVLAALLGTMTSAVEAVAAEENTVIATIELTTSQDDQIRDFVFSPDQSLLYVATSKTIRVIDTSTNTVVGSQTLADPLQSHRLEQLAISTTGDTLYAANYGIQTIEIFSLSNPRSPGSPAAVSLGFTPKGIAISPDGNVLFISNYNAPGTLRSLDLTVNPPALTAEATTVGNYPGRLELSSDGGTLYVLNEGSDSLSVVDTTVSPRTVTSTVSLGGTPYYLALSPDESTLFTSNNPPDVVSVIRTSDNTKLRDISGFQSPQAVAVTPDGDYLYVGQDMSSGHTVAVIDLSDDSIVGQVPVGDENRALAISQYGERVYVGNYASSPRSITVIERVLPLAPNARVTQTREAEESVPGIFLSLQNRSGEIVAGTTVGFGSFLIAPNAPYLLSVQGASPGSPQQILAQGVVNRGGHLEREITLGALPQGSHKVVLVSRGSRGELLTLTNVIAVDSQGRFVSITPEAMQPRVR